MKRRTVVGAAAALAAANCLPALGSAWPSKPVKIVVPFAAGGPTDFIARMMATSLSEALGQPVIVENRPGASGNLGAQFVADSQPDGYTLLHSTVAMQAVNPLMYRNTRFEYGRDLVALGVTGAMPNVLVVQPTKLQVDSVSALVKRAREKADALTYATFGNGTSPHIYGALLQKLGGFSAIAIPYKGSAPAITDVIAGQVDFLFDSMTTCVGQVQAGTLRGLAITASRRSSLLPDVPTLSEAGFPSFDLKFWFSLQAPAGTPAPVVERLRVAVAKVAASRSYQEQLAARGAESLAVAASGAVDFIAKDSQKWTEIAKTLEVKPE